MKIQDVFAAIIRAKRKKSVIRIHRHGLDYSGGYHEGFIVASNTNYVIMHRVDPGVVLDGYILLRISDITHFSSSYSSHSFIERALQLRSLHSICPFRLGARDTLSALILRIQILFPLITVYTERRFRDTCWIGRVSRLSSTSLFLRQITPSATWRHSDSRHSLTSISRIEFGGSYELALAEVVENTAEQDAAANP